MLPEDKIYIILLLKIDGIVRFDIIYYTLFCY
jgi:hypothetical protein